MTRYSLSALVAAGLLAGGIMASTSASAADLGGNCCADLEERVAELEATTARKGNRKVSLTISGFVAQQLLGWDDGDETNLYITDTGSVSIGTHFKFAGEAQIAPGWSAGYVLKVEAMNNDSLGVSQLTDEGGNAFAAGGSSFALESSYWFVKSDRLGRLSLGQQSSAADNQAILPDGSGSLVVANYVLYDVNSFRLRREGGIGNEGLTSLNWGQLGDCSTVGAAVVADCDGYPNNNIRYDTPTFAGFSASVSWGEDDVFSTSARYAGEWNSIKVAAAIAYTEHTDGFAPGQSASALQIGAYVQHVPTGLFLYGAYGDDEKDGDLARALDGTFEPDGDNWYLKAGIRQRWNPLGHTVLYGEYGENDDKLGPANFAAGISSSELTQYGLGVVQEIDAAAMSVWLAWRHYEGEVTCTAGGTFCNGGAQGFNGDIDVGNNDFEDLDIIKAGALINF